MFLLPYFYDHSINCFLQENYLYTEKEAKYFNTHKSYIDSDKILVVYDF